MLSTGFQTDWRHTVWAWWCLLLFFLETWRTSSSLIFSAGVGERGVAGGVNGWMRCSGGVLGVFQNCSRAHSDCLPVADSPQCWGMASFRPFHTEAESLKEFVP